jgi:hypothetical protein
MRPAIYTTLMTIRGADVAEGSARGFPNSKADPTDHLSLSQA